MVTSSPPPRPDFTPRPCLARALSVQALSKREALGWWRDKAGIIASIVIPALLNLIFSCVFFQVAVGP